MLVLYLYCTMASQAGVWVTLLNCPCIHTAVCTSLVEASYCLPHAVSIRSSPYLLMC